MFGNRFGGYENVECGLVSYWNDFPTFGYQRKCIATPLVSVSVFASVVHAVAQVEITQVYVNNEKNPIETFYYFPLDSNGAVTHFHAEIEGRKIKGVVKGNEEAKAEYDRAVEQKQTAFLGEQNKPDIFKIRIGYLKPGTQVEIVIDYVTEVKNEKGSSSMRFFLPTTVAPRYIPATETDQTGKDLSNMTFSTNSPAQMTIQVNVVLQGGIKTVKSPTHNVSVVEKGPVPEKTNWSRSIVQLKGLSTDMDRDFVLMITPEEDHIPRLYIEKMEKEGKKSVAAMTHLIPSFKLDEQKTELIFLLDTSGSMQGNSIELAKNALVLFLHSLPVDCYFNVVCFNSSFSSFFPTSVKYADINLGIALQYARGLQAMGGTELHTPLQHIYKLSFIPGYLRQIFLLTDGEVSNTEQILGLTRINAHRSRLFSLGIGSAASHHLVEGLASAGGGTSIFVTQNEPFEAKVLQQLKNAIEPSLTEISVTWDGLPESIPNPQSEVNIIREKTLFGYGKPIDEKIPTVVELPEESVKQAPKKIPPIFDGCQMVLFGIFETKELPTGITITAVSPDGPLSIKIPFLEENDVGPTGMLHNLAAVKVVRELEMELTALEYLQFDFLPRERRKTPDKIKSEIIDLACRNGIASKYTSFIGVDERNTESCDNWAMQTRFIPSQTPHGSLQRQVPFRGFGTTNYCLPQSLCNFSTSSPGQNTMFRSAQQLNPQGFSFGSQQPHFGSQQPQLATFGSQQPQSASLFGSQQPQSAPLFGSQQPQSAPLFGSQVQQSAPFFGSQQPPSATSFGSQQPQPIIPYVRAVLQSAMSFGSQQSQATFSFGSPQLQSSLFGSPQPQSTNLFGSQKSTTAGFSFSNSNAPRCNDVTDSSTAVHSFSTNMGFGTFGGGSQIENDNQKNVKMDPLHQIISCQSFLGVFSLNQTFVSVISKDLDILKREATENSWDENAWATALAIAFLQQKLADRKEAWELVYKKARKWLENNYGNILDSLLAAAMKIIN